MTAHRHIVGDQALIDAFRGLSEDMRSSTLVAGVKELVKPIVGAAKRFARRSRETGALEASQTSKVKNYPRSAKAVGLVGPDRDYYIDGKRAKGKLGRALAKINPERRRPSQYAHLLERGFIARDGTHVPAKPILAPAVSTTQAQQADGFYRGIERGYLKAVDRQVSAGRHVRR